MAQIFDKISADFLSAIKGVLEAKAHTVPVTDKEKKLAAMAAPKDKITHADVLKGRGVTREESDMPFKAPFKTAAERKDEYGNKVKNVAKHLAKKAMNAQKNEETLDEMSSKMKMKLGLYGKKKKMKEEAEELEELSVDAMKKYRTAARADAMDADDVDDDRRYRKRAQGSNEAGKKIVRKGGKLGEEAQQVDEISGDMKSRYKKAASQSMDQAQDFKSELDHEGEPKGSRVRKDVNRIIKNRKIGMKRANEEAEGLDELSTGTMRSYMDKASDARGHRKLSTKKVDNRYAGVQKASSKLTKEEVEGLHEISKATMGRYINKAKDSIDNASYRSGIKDGTAISSSTPYTPKNPLEKKLTKRHKGIETAVKKLTKEEIEMIEAKMAGVAPGSMDCDKHMCATKVFHKEWAEGTPIKTMHADPDTDGLIEWYDVMFDHGIERVMTEDMEVLQAESHMHSKKKMKEEIDADLEAELKATRQTTKSIRGSSRGAMGRAVKKQERNLAQARMDRAARKMGEETEQVDEVSKNLMLRYVSKAKQSAAVSTPKTFAKRMRGTDMAVRKYTATDNKYVRVPATEEVELDEARGRPKKTGQMDYTVHPRTKEKLMHNNPTHMKRIEMLQKNKVLDKPKTEANQHIMNQLQKAKISMQGGSTIQFTHGSAKHVSGTHAAKLLTKYAGMKPDEKEAFQKKIGHSHEQLMKHV